MDVESFWNNVKKLIKEQKTSQEWVANHCGISFPTFRNWIARNRLPDAIETYRIAQALNTSVEYLVTGENPGKPDTAPLIAQAQALMDGLKKL